MRRTSAILAIVFALLGIFQLSINRGDFFGITTAICIIVLLGSALSALRGAALIYLASAWSFYLGLNLAAYMDVAGHSFQKDDAGAHFVTVVALLLLFGSVVGLATALTAYRRETAP